MIESDVADAKMSRGPTTDERGQATVEFALVLPLVIIVVALIVQVAVIAALHLDVIAETSQIARAASMAEDPVAAAHFARSKASTVDIAFDDDSVTVSVSRRIGTDVALIGHLLPDLDVRSTLTMAREPFEP